MMTRYRSAIRLILAGLLLYPQTVAASVMQPAPLRPQSPFDMATTKCASDRRIDVPSVFAKPLDNTRMLALISFSESLSPGEQSAISARSSQSQELMFTALSKIRGTPCAPIAVTFAGIRMAYGIIRRWKSPPDLKFLAVAIADAMNAIDLGTSVDGNLRDSALAVFGTSTAALDQIAANRLRPPARKACREIDATAIDPASPETPESSDQTVLVGYVRVEVVLDRYGFVRLAKLYNQTLNDLPSRPQAIAATIGAAAITTYTPEFSNCRSKPSTYLFTAGFAP